MTAYDLKLTALLLVLSPLAWLVQPRHFNRIAERLDRLLSLFYRTDGHALTNHVEAVAGDRIDPVRRAQITPTLRRLFLRDAMMVLRANRRGGAAPGIDVDGLDNLRTAVEMKQGVILWDGYFAQHETAIASGLSAAGYRPHYVRTDSHGFSPSAFGRWVLNPIHRRAQQKYCDYIVLGRNPAAGIRAIKAALDAAEIVVMVASPWGGRASVTVPFLSGGLELVPGPAKLAASTGTPLLPICNFLDPERGLDRLVIGQPLAAPDRSKSDDSADCFLNEFAEWLESVVEMRPDQWLGWSHVVEGFSDTLGSADAGAGLG